VNAHGGSGAEGGEEAAAEEDGLEVVGACRFKELVWGWGGGAAWFLCTQCVLKDIVYPAGLCFLQGGRAESDVVEFQHGGDGDGYLLSVKVRGEGDDFGAISH